MLAIGMGRRRLTRCGLFTLPCTRNIMLRRFDLGRCQASEGATESSERFRMESLRLGRCYFSAVDLVTSSLPPRRPWPTACRAWFDFGGLCYTSPESHGRRRLRRLIMLFRACIYFLVFLLLGFSVSLNCFYQSTCRWCFCPSRLPCKCFPPATFSSFCIRR